MSTKSQPVIVWILGSFCLSGTCDPVVDPLRQKGYDIYVPDLPCYPAGYDAGNVSPAPDMYDDAKAIKEFIEKIADEQGKEIIVIAHSYGGVPATESLKSITKHKRTAQGKKGGVVRIAYVAACVPKIGQNLGQVFEGKGGAIVPLAIDENSWMYHTDTSATASVLFSSLPSEISLPEAAKIGRHSAPSFASQLTYAGYKDVPVSWFVCKEDVGVLPTVQQIAIDMIEESWVGTLREGRQVDVKRVKCDHMPMFSATKELCGWMEELVRKGGEE